MTAASTRLARSMSLKRLRVLALAVCKSFASVRTPSSADLFSGVGLRAAVASTAARIALRSHRPSAVHGVGVSVRRAQPNRLRVN